MSSEPTSIVMLSGIAPISESIATSCTGWLSTPPMFTPGAEPSMWMATLVLTVWSARTSWRSMWMTRSRTGSSWRSLIIAVRALPPSSETSRIVWMPSEPDTACRRSRAPTVIAVVSVLVSDE